MTVIRGISSFLEAYEREAFDNSSVQLVSLSESFNKLVLLSLLTKAYDSDVKTGSFRKIICILPTAKNLSPWLHFFEDTISDLNIPNSRLGMFPSYSLWGADRLINPISTRKQRMMALSIARDKSSLGIILTTLPALAQQTISLEEFEQASLTLNVGDDYDQDDLIEKLYDLGYQKTSKVTEEGTWTIRGGILDIFPLNYESPLRMEFFADTLESARFFSIENQRSKKEISSVSIVPACEALTPAQKRQEDAQKLYDVLLEQEIPHEDRDGMMATFMQGYHFAGFDVFTPIFRSNSSSLLDYIPNQVELIFPRTMKNCIASAEEYYQEKEEAWLRDQQAKRATLSPSKHFLPFDQIENKLINEFHSFELGNPLESNQKRQIRLEGKATLAEAPIKTNTTANDENFKNWIKTIANKLKAQSSCIALLVRGEESAQNTKSLLEHYNLSPQIQSDLLAHIARGNWQQKGIYIGQGHLDSHLWIDETELLILSEDELLGTTKTKRKSAPKRLRNYLSSFKDLKINDLVVHLSHGIGRYLGMTTLEVAKIPSDFLILEYAGKDRIYLPVDKLNLLQRYSSSSEKTAPLDKLGGQSWTKRKSRVKKAIKDMADDLLKLQAKRELSRPHVYSLPGESYLKFEEEFPYQETEDQIRVLEDVEADLTSAKLMDRLIVGDVGFGKTEIAIRTCYRAVLEGFQVLVLVPTTILCYQHFQNFSQRLSKHGVNVRQMNRFVKGKELKETVDGLKSGAVDIVIGTHRLLSKDIIPKRLGLLIVDEEQRFGVAHKERIKVMRANADILTLTATPIPRTLHMAMLGLREISVIATPPSDRLAVRTYISKFDEQLIKEAIETELGRGGQVFYVHNRVQDIDEVATFVRSLVPSIEIRTAHGQMNETQLEKVTMDFIEQKFSVLICTTIIESGIDMPNVNTIIVNRADQFGLAQLYQLRGRVGRSSVQAYAYLFTPPTEQISVEAEQRLTAIATHQELGSGFHIASHDLEIRGAGNLLGAEQSGQITAIGIELYTDMLDSVIKEMRGEISQEKQEIEFKINISAIIPINYIESESERLSIYKDMFSADTAEELHEIKTSLKDQYGACPPELVRLFAIAHIKRTLREINATSLAPGKTGMFELKFGSLTEEQINKIIEISKEQPQNYHLLSDYTLILAVGAPKDHSISSQEDILKNIRSLLEPLLHKMSK
ncbi:MAG: transcription-repair coupling factor [Bdellovibrionota bacterium]